MKIKFILLIVAFATIISCNKNDVQKTTDKGIAKSSYVTKSLVASEEMLSFSSDKEMYETAAMLAEMSKNDLNTWYNSKNSNFKSIEQIYREAINEFEEFGNLEIPDFKVAEEIKDKYKHILLFNSNSIDEDLYYPLLPLKNDYLSYVCNKNGNVMINGQAKNLRDIQLFEETEYYKTLHQFKTRAIEEVINYVWIQDGKRRMWARAEKRSGSGAHLAYAVIQLSAQKKTWLGWNYYRTEYYLSHQSIDRNSWGPLYDDYIHVMEGKALGEQGSGKDLRIAQFKNQVNGTLSVRIGSRGTGGQTALLNVSINVNN